MRNACAANQKCRRGRTEMKTVGFLGRPLGSEAKRVMKPSEHLELIRRLESARARTCEVDGKEMPKSIAILLGELASENEREARYDLYYQIMTECLLTNRPDLEVMFLERQYLEFSDLNSLMCLADAFVRDGRFAEGIHRGREALEMAINTKSMINDAAVSYVRHAIKTGSVSEINLAIEHLISSTDAPRSEDSALELDWVGRAEALRIDKDLLAKVRALGKKKSLD